jgi:hypothetical protein
LATSNSHGALTLAGGRWPLAGSAAMIALPPPPPLPDDDDPLVEVLLALVDLAEMLDRLGELVDRLGWAAWSRCYHSSGAPAYGAPAVDGIAIWPQGVLPEGRGLPWSVVWKSERPGGRRAAAKSC